MSDPATEPGAPVHPPSDDKPLSKEVASLRDAVPSRLTSLVSSTDRLAMRLNKLLASPGGLSSFLSTFNYTLYLLAYLETKTPSVPRLSQLFLKLLNYRRQSASPKPAATVVTPALTGPSSFVSLATLLSSSRTTMRLFGLLPLYAWLRTLLKGPKPGQDRPLYYLSFAQCVSYVAFQGLENIALLTDHNVLPKNMTSRLNKGVAIPSTKIYLWSYRAWMVGVLCDFPRLIREATLESRERKIRSRSEKEGRTGMADAKRQEDVKIDEKWWSDLVVPLAWLPVAVHCSIEGGIPGMNLGIMGVCGGLAGLGRTSSLWAATKDV